MEEKFFEVAPTEIIKKIFHLFDTSTMLNVSMVNKKFKQWAHNDAIFWREVVQRHFPSLKNEGNNFFDLFKRDSSLVYQKLETTLKKCFFFVKEEDADALKRHLLNPQSKITITCLDKPDTSMQTLAALALRKNNPHILRVLFELIIKKHFSDNGVIDIKKEDKCEQTILYWAAKFGQADYLQVLIKQGANVNVANKESVTPLHIAAMHGHLETVDLLLANGADINAIENMIATPLHYALLGGHLGVVSLLLEKKAEVEAINADGLNTFHFAVRGGNLKVIELLLTKKNNIKSITDTSLAPPRFAPKQRMKFIVNLFRLDHYNTKCLTALHIAAIEKHLPVIKFLLEKGLDINAVDELGKTPLCYTAAVGTVEIFNFLVANGANKFVSSKANPLSAAVKFNNQDMIELLLVDKVANPFEYYESPLDIASSNGDLELVKRLIEKGANINGYKYNLVPLRTAIENQKLEIVKWLLANGANVDIRLIQGGSNQLTSLHIAVMRGYLDMVEVLLANSATVDVVDDFGSTPLYYAAMIGRSEIVKELLKNGANVNVVCEKGETPLSIAKARGHQDIVELLEQAANLRHGIV